MELEDMAKQQSNKTNGTNTSNNSNGSNNNNQAEYKNWTWADWNASSWAIQELKDFQNMTVQDVKGWTGAYFFFKAAETSLVPSTNLTDLIYDCLPIMSGLLALPERNQSQWRHLTKFLSAFTASRWNGPRLNDRILELAKQKTMCVSCPSTTFAK